MSELDGDREDGEVRKVRKVLKKNVRPADGYENNSRNIWILEKCYWIIYLQKLGLAGGSEVKASAWNAGDPGSIPGSGRSPGEGNGNPLQYSGLENPMEGGAW